jgi:hypothetical protein
MHTATCLLITLVKTVPERSNKQIRGLQLSFGNPRKTRMQWKYSILASSSVQRRPCEIGEQQTEKSDVTRVSAETMVKSLHASHFVHTCLGCTPLTSACYVNFNSWMKKGKTLKT